MGVLSFFFPQEFVLSELTLKYICNCDYKLLREDFTKLAGINVEMYDIPLKSDTERD